MKRKSFVKRVLASVLSAAVVVSTLLPAAGTAVTVEAASTYENENLLANADFESAFGSSHIGNWNVWQSVEKSTDDAKTGEASGKFAGAQSSLEQDLTGLQNGMTYVFSVWAKLSADSDAEQHMVGVKNFGGEEIKVQVTSKEWKEYKIEFVPTNGGARVYGWVDAHNGIDMYIDDASVSVKSDIESITIENGKIIVTVPEGVSLKPDDFSATYTTSVDSTVKELELTATPDYLTFDKIEAKPVAQTVTVELTYKDQVITLDFEVAASGEAVVEAKMVKVEASQAANGTVKVTLDAEPTVKPVEDDFTWEYKVDDGEYKELAVSDFAYANKVATASYSNIRGSFDAASTITVKVTYAGESKEASYEVEKATSNVYYVDSKTGKDTNDGLTEATAFASIDKLNTITFAPGDEILFKRGETFQGCFKPQGSGEEGAPIVIGAYGDGEERPVLIPGKEWTVTHVMSANAIVHNAKVNYVIQFYNVEFWEVNDLEIMDPDSEEYLTKGSSKYIGNSANDVYRSGITIQAEDIGTLEHFYIDNVVVHGFHGPGTNIGKTSGGITMNVITNAQRDISRSVPTQINDIRVTNCEIYDVGRSGMNFLTPWSFRNEEKWGPFNYGTRGYDYLPYEDFYMANNYIHDVDGDGTIIDNCSNAVAEYNLVTRCCLRPQTEGGGAAVGLFNWNSDDTYFQFNEVYDIRPGSGASASNDSQGIEIDALNDRTWVQYNYVHDNYGGFMMLCNVSDNYRSFDGIIRYNISQDDYAHPRQGMFDMYAANYGTECYNNTFYMTERALKPNSDQIFLFSTAAAYETMKFYNNIFYYDGATPAAANTFGDGAIDWQSNIFYGFTNMPVDDNPGAPNINTDPMLVAIGEGGTGEYPGDQVDLSCYYTTEGSPAIDAGVPLENNGGRDYFGNPLTSIPDIGAYESGSIALKVVSTEYAIDQEAMTATVSGKDLISVADMMANLFAEEGVEVTINRDGVALADGVVVKDGDIVVGAYDGETVEYAVVIDYSGTNEVPQDEMTATAGDYQNGEGPELAIDGNTGTMWHTDWYNGPNHDDHWIQLEIDTPYMVDGLTYVPRQSGANGIITAYEIYVSMDGFDWELAAEGTWPSSNAAKTVTFDAVEAKFVMLQTVEATTDQALKFASAAEIVVLGYEDKTCDGHETELVGKADATEDRAGYTGDEICKNCGEVVVEGELIMPTGAEPWVNPFDDVEEGKWYYDAVAWGSQNGVVNGLTETLFGTKENCTRGQIITFIWRAMGEPKADSTEYTFKDVEEGKYYFEAMLWGVEKGIITGYDADTFAPNDQCTRAQMATFIWRLAGKPEAEAEASMFPDVEEGKWYTTAATWAAENEVVTGYDDGTFGPDNNVLRSETITMLYRYFK